MAEYFEGEEEVLRKLSNFLRNAPKELGQALYQEAEIEATESQSRTPVKTGALKGSHEVGNPVETSNEISVTISVGGPAAPYAIYVHEDLEAFHETGQAKFLESTIMESRPFVGTRVSKRIDLNRMV